MVAFLCHFYGWSVPDCLKLPIRTFFALHKQAIQMEARQYRELLDIQAVSIMKIEYYNFMRERYMGIIFPEKRELPPAAPGPVLDAASAEAKVVIMDVFASLKRNLGYGGSEG
jgi:hypothetical protein